MLGFEKIIELKINEAMENGEFDNLPLKGQPLELEDLSNVPEELRMGFKVLKNAGILPEELQLKKEIFTIEELLKDANLKEEQERSLKQQVMDKIMKYRMIVDKKNT